MKEAAPILLFEHDAVLEPEKMKEEEVAAAAGVAISGSKKMKVADKLSVKDIAISGSIKELANKLVAKGIALSASKKRELATELAGNGIALSASTKRDSGSKKLRLAVKRVAEKLKAASMGTPSIVDKSEHSVNWGPSMHLSSNSSEFVIKRLWKLVEELKKLDAIWRGTLSVRPNANEQCLYMLILGHVCSDIFLFHHENNVQVPRLPQDDVEWIARGAGLDAGSPGLHFGFGVGAGCGIGLGFGYGVGRGIAYDETRRHINVGKLF